VDDQEAGPGAPVHTDPSASLGVYESDIARGQGDFDLEGPDLAGTYQQELEPDAGRRPQEPRERPRDPRPDPQPGPESGVTPPPIPPLGTFAGAPPQAGQSRPPEPPTSGAAKPPRPQSPGAVDELQLLELLADGDPAAQHVSAEDIGRWISGLDEDHPVSCPPLGGAHSSPPAQPTPRAASVSDGAPRVQSVSGPTPPPLPAPMLDEPVRRAGPSAFKPRELTGLLTPEELEALLGRDK